MLSKVSSPTLQLAAGQKGPRHYLELFAAGGALELVAVAAAAFLAVPPPHIALEGLTAVLAENHFIHTVYRV